MTQQYFGKYRGTVVNNVDPLVTGRIQAIVPDVSGIALSSWCMPCFPMTGIQTGNIAVPPIGAGVWIEFEKGDPDYPIWTGGFFGSAAEVPALAQLTPPGVSSLTMQTTLQNGVTVTDLPGPTGGIVLKTTAGASLIVNDTGIYIQNGRGASITLVGPTVTVNNGALTVI
ncbi:phage baseplate assembly protein V [Algicella marina]|uniref:Baseplate assembly protein n=1 Tax=Algicella marina TaxID=2683284 RepID=A0A6P1T4H8_9RHOB|nr:phage baseplate assembly protein V [Algicella marina]QHQ36671.1 baseplate assembly protein [Algicella marina]